MCVHIKWPSFVRCINEIEEKAKNRPIRGIVYAYFLSPVNPCLLGLYLAVSGWLGGNKRRKKKKKGEKKKTRVNKEEKDGKRRSGRNQFAE